MKNNFKFIKIQQYQTLSSNMNYPSHDIHVQTLITPRLGVPNSANISANFRPPKTADSQP